MTTGCYDARDIQRLLKMSSRDFRRKVRQGQLPFLEELRPRVGRARYRKDLVDRYLAGEWQQPKTFYRRSA